MPTPRCILCDSTDHTPVNAVVRHAEKTEAVTCNACGLTYLWPRPDAQALDRFYAEEYRALYDTTTVAERHQEDLAEAQLRIERLGPLLPESGRLLKIGSGSCAFLRSAAGRVAEAVGIEPDQKTRDWIADVSGLAVYPEFSALPDDAGRFDLIVLFHVLEHLPDPVAFLKAVAKRLNPGAKLVIEVPNVDDALLSLYDIQAFRDFYFSIAHLTYFSPSTLARCIAMAGLEGAVTGVQRYDLSNHLTWALTGKPGGARAFAPPISAQTDRHYAEDLIRSGKADTLWGVFTCIGGTE